MDAGTWTINEAERQELWTLKLWLSEREKELLKQFLSDNNIQIESVEQSMDFNATLKSKKAGVLTFEADVDIKLPS